MHGGAKFGCLLLQVLHFFELFDSVIEFFIFGIRQNRMINIVYKCKDGKIDKWQIGYSWESSKLCVKNLGEKTVVVIGEVLKRDMNSGDPYVNTLKPHMSFYFTFSGDDTSLNVIGVETLENFGEIGRYKRLKVEKSHAGLLYDAVPKDLVFDCPDGIYKTLSYLWSNRGSGFKDENNLTCEFPVKIMHFLTFVLLGEMHLVSDEELSAIDLHVVASAMDYYNFGTAYWNMIDFSVLQDPNHNVRYIREISMKNMIAKKDFDNSKIKDEYLREWLNLLPSQGM